MSYTSKNLMPAKIEEKIEHHREITLEQQELLVACMFCGDEYSGSAPNAIEWFKYHKKECNGSN